MLIFLICEECEHWYSADTIDQKLCNKCKDEKDSNT